ncbi:MAG: FGGY family carbohydrate kinase, partial [Acidimicrobiia bacterium]
MALVVALDAGTTGVRALAFRDDGTVVGTARRELAARYPRPGWVEQDPVEIVEAARDVLCRLAAGLDEPVAAVGITNQRETAVAWDLRHGEPCHPAVVWQDRRTAERCDALAGAGHLDLVRR